VAVAAQVSPAGPRAAGRYGCSLLSLGATNTGGFDVLGAHWQVLEERAAEFGHTPDRANWRLVGPMHIAPTEEQARAEVAYGLGDWIDYFRNVAALPLAPESDDPDKLVEAVNGSGLAVIGTPEMAVAQIERLINQSGGFGTYLFMGHDWANRQATLASYELFAKEVMPHFQGSAVRTVDSRNWAAENRPEFIGAATTAVISAIQSHHAEKAAKEAQTSPTQA
jgi:limonene 1,2-monooxygenase